MSFYEINRTVVDWNTILIAAGLTFFSVVIAFKVLWYMMGTMIHAPRKNMIFFGVTIAIDTLILLAIWLPSIYRKFEIEMTPFVKGIDLVPEFVWALYISVSTILCIYVREQLKVWRRTHVTVKSLHQALDYLPMGVCVYRGDGILQMANYQMQKLCLELTGKPLLNGRFLENEVWKRPEQIITLEDGTIWIFRRQKGENGTVMITASEVTKIVELNRELEAENIQLEGINHRMRQYGQNLGEIIRQEELLNAQIRVHDELGHILLVSRIFLNGSECAVGREQLKKEWDQLLTSLHYFEDTATDASQIRELTKIAKALGIELQIDGRLPTQLTLLHLLAAGARECLTNAAKAGATKLVISIRKEDKDMVICYYNDGACPEGPVQEGVGLGTLRQIVEREGARMYIDWEPEYILRIKMQVS